MHYVKHFHINGVDTRQVACIELHGKPNAATEGWVGVLGIDMDSPLHDVYKCVAVNGAIYTWELLSSGMSVISANISLEGGASVQFPYANLRTPAMYVVKIGDLIFDKEGYLYQIVALNTTYCDAVYCDTQGLQGAPGKNAYEYAIECGYTGSEAEFTEMFNIFLGMGETVPIEKGGTDANNVVTARSNLGVAPAPIVSITDITAGSTALAAGQSYLVYE